MKEGFYLGSRPWCIFLSESAFSILMNYHQQELLSLFPPLSLEQSNLLRITANELSGLVVIQSLPPLTFYGVCFLVQDVVPSSLHVPYFALRCLQPVLFSLSLPTLSPITAPDSNQQRIPEAASSCKFLSRGKESSLLLCIPSSKWSTTN